MARRPIVDLSRKPSRWRRFVAWCWSLFDAPPEYPVQICEPCDARTVHIAIIGLLVAVAFMVYALRGLWL